MLLGETACANYRKDFALGRRRIFISFSIRCLLDQAILKGVLGGFKRGISKFILACTLTLRGECF